MASRYAIFTDHYPPEAGGVASFAQHLAHELAESGDRVHVITQRTPDAPDHERQEDGVELWRLPARMHAPGFPAPQKGAEYTELFGLLLKLNIDRVLVNGTGTATSVEALRFAQAKGVPAVALAHRASWLAPGAGAQSTLLRRYERRNIAQAKQFHPIFAGVSRSSCEWLRSFDIASSIVIPAGIDARAFRASASSRSFRAELGVQDIDRLVAFIGPLTPEKGALKLAESAAQLGDRCIVAMAGEGPERKAITQLGLPNVHLLGPISEADISALLAESDLFCLPSASEGFGMPLLEAAVWGVVPVVPHVGAADEILGNPPEFGKFLTSTDPEVIAWTLVEAVKQCGSRETMSFRSRVGRRFTWAATAEVLRAAYE